MRISLPLGGRGEQRVAVLRGTQIRKLSAAILQELRSLADALLATAATRARAVPLLARLLLLFLVHGDFAGDSAASNLDVLRAFGELLLLNKYDCCLTKIFFLMDMYRYCCTIYSLYNWI